jgi:hypothetical protein
MDHPYQGFRDDPRFLTSRDKAYKRVVNDTSIFKLDLPSTKSGAGSKTTPESKCPELLANYCDMLLRKTPLSKVGTCTLYVVAAVISVCLLRLSTKVVLFGILALLSSA